jgi:pimeloyl-ACP methyl ester carboxylesterase
MAAVELVKDIAPLAEGEELYRLPFGDCGPRLFLRRLPATGPSPRGVKRAALYLHGARLASSMTIAHRFDGWSWRDDLAAKGWDLWAMDYLGYGHSDWYPEMDEAPDANGPLGRARPASEQVETAVRYILEHSGLPKMSLISHSWGTNIAALVTIRSQNLIDRVAMFGPVTHRESTSSKEPAPPVPAWQTITVEEWWKTFNADVPEGHAPVFLPRLFDIWGQEYLKCDPHSRDRSPPSVKTPWGALTDVSELWGGGYLYDPADIKVPVLIVRGEWDSYATDIDANWLMNNLTNTPQKRDVKIGRGSHFMLFEESRFDLYQEVASFLDGVESRTAGASLPGKP